MSSQILRKRFVEQLENAKNPRESSVAARHEVKPDQGDTLVQNLANTYDPAIPPEDMTAYDPARARPMDFFGTLVTPAPGVQPSTMETAASYEAWELRWSEAPREEPVVEQTMTKARGEPAVDCPSSSLWEIRASNVHGDSSSDSPSDTPARTRGVGSPVVPISSKRQRIDAGGSTSQIRTDTRTPPLALPEAAGPRFEATHNPGYSVLLQRSVDELERQGATHLAMITSIQRALSEKLRNRELRLHEHSSIGVRLNEARGVIHALGIVISNGSARENTEKLRADSESQRADAEKQRADEAEQLADEAEQRADAAEQRADAERQRADVERQRADEALQYSASQKDEVLGLHLLVDMVMADNTALGSAYEKVRTAFDNGKDLIMMAALKAKAAEDEARQFEAHLKRESEEEVERLKAEVLGAKLTGAREFMASNVFQSLVSRAAAEELYTVARLVLSQLRNKGFLAANVDMSYINLAGDEYGIVAEPSPDEIANMRASQPYASDPYYSLLDNQVIAEPSPDEIANMHASQPHASNLYYSLLYNQINDQSVVAGTSGNDPSGAGPSGTSLDAGAGGGP